MSKDRLERIREKHEKIKKWAQELTPEQMQRVIVDMVTHAIDCEDVRMGDLAPYWESCGEPLVEGQKTWADLEEITTEESTTSDKEGV